MTTEKGSSHGTDIPKPQRAPTMAEIFTENTGEFDPEKLQDNDYLDGLLGSIAPGKIYPTEAVDGMYFVLKNHTLLDKDILEDFALNALEALANYPFKIHSDVYSAKIEQHCRVMAATIHAIYDSGIKSLQKEEHQGIYESVIKFCGFCEKQDLENDNVRFKLAEIRNGLTIIETDESLVLVIFERAQNIVNAAKAAYAGNYIEAIQDFIEGCKFKLPEARWFSNWIQIRAAQYTCRQLLYKFDEIKNFDAVPMEFFALLNAQAQETMKKGAITKMKKMTSKFSHFVSHVSGSAETDEPGCLIFGILDVLQDVLSTQIKGQLMDGTCQLASDVLFWSGSSFVRSKAAEVLVFIKQMEPSQSSNVDDILQRFRKGLPDQVHQRKFDTLLKRVNLGMEIRFQLRSSQRRHTALHMSQAAQDKMNSSNGLAAEIAQQEQAKPQLSSLISPTDDTDNSSEAKTQRIKDFRFKPPPILLQCGHAAPKYIESAVWSTGKVLCDVCKKDIELDATIAAKTSEAQALQVFLQQKGVSPNKTDSNGYTLAQCTILWSINPAPVLKVLIAAGADMNVFIENFDNGHYIEHHKSLLHLAASDGNVDSLDVLLRCVKINPNIQDGEGRTAAHDICYKTPAPYKGLALLLRHGLDINLKHNDGRTPAFQLLERCPDPKETLNSFRLMLNAGIDLSFIEEELQQNTLSYVCSFCLDSYDLLELALRYKSEPNQRDCDGRTPIFFLMLGWSKQSKALELLSRHGADFNVKGGYGNIPVFFFARSPCVDVAESLAILEKNNVNIKELDPLGNTVVHVAAQQSANAAVMIKAFVDLGVDINAVGQDGITAMHLTTAHEIQDVGLEATRMLIELGANINVLDNNGLSPLHYACYGASNIEFVRILLENGAQVNARTKNIGFTPMHLACNSADPISLFKLLLEFGADPIIKTNDEQTLLHTLAQNKDSTLESMHFVKEIGIDMSAVTSPSHGGFNAAHLAALWMSNPVETIWFLLGCGIDPDAQTAKGANILHYLTDNASALPLFKKLIAKGADPNCKSLNGETLLHKVAQNNNSPIEWFEFLMDDYKIKYDMNAETEQGDTPITYLASNWITPGVFDWCVAHGANPAHHNKQNHSVFSLAAQFLQLDAVEYLYNKYPEFQTRIEIQTAIDLVEQLKVEKAANEEGDTTIGDTEITKNGEGAAITGDSEITKTSTEEVKPDINANKADLGETSEATTSTAIDSNPITESPIAVKEDKLGVSISIEEGISKLGDGQVVIPEDENMPSNQGEDQTGNDETTEEESDGSKAMLEILKGWLKLLPEDII